MSAGHVARVSGSDGKTYPTNRAANRDAIRAAIEADPKETNTAIAKRLGTSRDTVIAVRRSLGEADALAALDATHSALATADNITDVKTIRDKAKAIQSYAREARDTAMFEKASRLFMEAERRAGELLKAMKEHGQRASETGDVNPGNVDKVFSDGTPSRPTTLDELGITRKQAMKWTRLAEMAQKNPDAYEAHVLRTTGRVLAVIDPDSITRAMREAMQEQNEGLQTISVPIPEGRYGCIVIDPPWDMQKIEREVRPRQAGFDYPVMSEEQLAAFDVPAIAADDCHLFCWTTQKHLPVALRLVDAWGFRYVFLMVWHKAGGFQPVGLPQYNCEFIVYARRGSPQFADTKAFNVCFEAPRREHSRKPDFFYELVARVTEGPRIDVFSREAREGFEQFGNEPARFSDVV
ncbi:N6-adenosine-specific RNA methylase IME4 [Paraburkholderia atlantica]|uniref:MT-A70 family methyltransferase n=1 Tax=Paraburkholderia atlantica TaxID=2654982 RepID=UPI003D1A5E74